MNNDNQTFVTVLATLFVVMAMFAVGIVIGQKTAPAAAKTDKDILWEQIEKICNLDKKTPQLTPVKLPNGNLGFNITCEEIKSA